jgi:hypothetical protein
MKIKKIFEIEFDEPSPHWLCADNLAVALNDYCKGGVPFKVSELARYPDYGKEMIVHKNIRTETQVHRGSDRNYVDVVDKDTGILLIRYDAKLASAYEQNLQYEKKRCEEVGIEMPTPIPFHELGSKSIYHIPAVSICEQCGEIHHMSKLYMNTCTSCVAEKFNAEMYPSIKDASTLPPGVQRCSVCGMIMSANTQDCINCDNRIIKYQTLPHKEGFDLEKEKEYLRKEAEELKRGSYGVIGSPYGYGNITCKQCIQDRPAEGREVQIHQGTGVDIIYGDSAENIYEQSIVREKKRCEDLGIEMPKYVPFSELSNMTAGIRVCPECGKTTCAFDPTPCKGCGYTAGTDEDKKRARYYKELAELDNYTVGTGMCNGCGKLRGSMAIYGGVACEECGYKPERLTQESLKKKHGENGRTEMYEKEIEILERKIKEKIKMLEENPEGTNITWVWNLVDMCWKLKQFSRFDR